MSKCSLLQCSTVCSPVSLDYMPSSLYSSQWKLSWVQQMGDEYEVWETVSKNNIWSPFLPFCSLQFKCCGWNNYTDWSWNLYFNCTPSNPSTERCSVPFSCCTPLPEEVRLNQLHADRSLICTYEEIKMDIEISRYEICVKRGFTCRFMSCFALVRLKL